METKHALPADVKAALHRLETILRDYGSMVVAYSGGVDSGLLAYCASQTLGQSALAVIGISPSLPKRELDFAIAFLERHAIPYHRVATEELGNEEYSRNHPDRCYHCKGELFSKLQDVAHSRGLNCIAYGANADDAEDYRPGSTAALEHRVAAPLAEAGMGKEMIRRLARGLSLELWDKPASPCLASRIPYYSPVDAGKLEQIERAENVLKDLGFPVCRVRHHGDTARIELLHQDCIRLFEHDLWQRAVEMIRQAGFTYVTLDIEGFKSGRLNDAIDASIDIKPADS